MTYYGNDMNIEGIVYDKDRKIVARYKVNVNDIPIKLPVMDVDIAERKEYRECMAVDYKYLKDQINYVYNNLYRQVCEHLKDDTLILKEVVEYERTHIKNGVVETKEVSFKHMAQKNGCKPKETFFESMFTDTAEHTEFVEIATVSNVYEQYVHSVLKNVYQLDIHIEECALVSCDDVKARNITG